MKRLSLAIAAAAAVLVCLAPRHAAAQSAKPTQPAMHKTSAGQPNDDVFTRIAPKLYTSASNLKHEFATARRENAKLTRREFLTAVVLSQNLSGEHPAITTHAILIDRKKGRPFHGSLEGLGLTATAATTALQEAQREVHAAESPTPAMERNPHSTRTMKQDSTKAHRG
jgi:hypothetical protein